MTALRVCAGLLAYSLVSPSVSAQGERAQDPADRARQEPFTVDVNLVTLRFSIKDPGGRFVNDKKRENFTIRENGQQREIVFFEPPRFKEARLEPLWLGILIDVSGSTFATRAEEILAARSFFENIHDFAQVGIYGFTDTMIPFREFSPNKEAALQAFNSARRHLGKTALYASVDELIRLMSRRAQASDRKVIIVVSDGIDEHYARSSATSSLANQTGVTIHTIWVPSATQLYIGPSGQPADGGSPEMLQDREKKRAAFAALSQRSGGRHFGGFETILNFGDVLSEINDDISGNLYTIGYHTDNPLLERDQRQVDIELDEPGLQVLGVYQNVRDRVSAKRSYIEALFDNRALELLPDSTPTEFHEIGAQVDLLRPSQLGNNVGLPFRIRISPFSLESADDRDFRTRIGVIGLLLDEGGNEVVRLREVFRVSLSKKQLEQGSGITYTNRFAAPPGRYLLRLALVEIPSWRMTVFESPVEMSFP